MPWLQDSITRGAHRGHPQPQRPYNRAKKRLWLQDSITRGAQRRQPQLQRPCNRAEERQAAQLTCPSRWPLLPLALHDVQVAPKVTSTVLQRQAESTEDPAHCATTAGRIYRKSCSLYYNGKQNRNVGLVDLLEERRAGRHPRGSREASWR